MGYIALVYVIVYMMYFTLCYIKYVFYSISWNELFDYYDYYYYYAQLDYFIAGCTPHRGGGAAQGTGLGEGGEVRGGWAECTAL